MNGKILKIIPAPLFGQTPQKEREKISYLAAFRNYYPCETLVILFGIPGFDGFDVRKIDDIEYTVEISCYFLTKWRDDRLVLHEKILKENSDGSGERGEGENGEPAEEQWFPIDLEFVAKVRTYETFFLTKNGSRITLARTKLFF